MFLILHMLRIIYQMHNIIVTQSNFKYKHEQFMFYGRYTYLNENKAIDTS